ncbi:MAG: hypothetical protein V2A61_03355, partial [Calditrichota bacterium]
LIGVAVTQAAAPASFHPTDVRWANLPPARIIQSDEPLSGPNSNIPHQVPRRDEADDVAVGEDRTIGWTWYDLQHNGSHGKMVALDTEGGRHFCWTRGYNNQQNPRHVVYNYIDPDGQLLLEPGDIGLVDVGPRSGYCCLDLLPADQRPVIFYHVLGHIQNNPNQIQMAFSVDWRLGFGAFIPFYMPLIQGIEVIWPHGVVDQQNVVHIIGTESAVGDQIVQRLYYGRAVPDRIFENWRADEALTLVDEDNGVISAVAAASPQSNRVALAWHHNRVGADLGIWENAMGAWQRNNDLRCIISEDGEDWNFENDAQSITKIIPCRPELARQNFTAAYGDTFRPYCDVDLAFDPWEGSDQLYAAFAACGMWEDPIAQDNPVIGVTNEQDMLWFWNGELDTLTLIYDGWYFNRTDNGGFWHSRTGAWRMNADRPSIAFDADNPGTIFVTWVHFPQIMDVDENGDFFYLENEHVQDTSQTGYINAEIMVSVSTDYGVTWLEPVNVTGTIWEGEEAAPPGECASEAYQSAAEATDGTLHIMYVRDTDAGGIAQQEGQATISPVVYHRVPIADLNIEDLEPYPLPRRDFIFHNYLPPERRHFMDFEATDEFCVVHVEDLIHLGEPASSGWEVGAFTPEGILAGSDVWIWDERMLLTVYGDDPDTEPVEGFTPNQTMSFQAWDDEADVEYPCIAEVAEGELNWQRDAETLLTLFTAREQTIRFRQGWNIISFNIIPTRDLWRGDRGPDVVLLLDRLRIDERRHNVQFVKDGLGRFYRPDFGFCNIPYWDLSEGYKVKVTEACQATWIGVPIRADAPQNLGQGWNFVAYYPFYELDASAPLFYVLSPIIEHVIIAKDVLGNFMLPRFNFSNMLPWRAEQGYQVCVDEAVELRYPPPRPGLAMQNAECKMQNAEFQAVFSDRNMSLLVKGIKLIDADVDVDDDGSAILQAVSQDGMIVGQGTVTPDGVCGLAVWGDDPDTPGREGLREGETFSLMSMSMSKPMSMNPSSSTSALASASALTFQANGWAVVDIEPQIPLPTELRLEPVDPNPFNQTARISYQMPQSGRASLKVMDSAGRRVAELTDAYQPAGVHSLVWTADNL